MTSLLFRGVHRSSERIVATIGNFDGMHRGHAVLFSELVTMAKSENAKPTLISFYPHPKYYFARLNGRSLAREDGVLNSPREKLFRAEAAGIEQLVLLRFSEDLAQLAPAEFFEKKILPLGKLCGVIVGRDWCFGKDKAGNIQTLSEFGKRYDFKVKILEDQSIDGVRISSSLIRKKIVEGDVHLAATYLGYTYSLSGHVKKGDQRGRLLGFPTMNLLFDNDLLPAYGVYKTRTVVRGVSLPSVTNVGVRPTFSGVKAVVETHVIEGFSGENYGERIEISFIERIRAEKKFANIDELKAQITQDISIARR